MSHRGSKGKRWPTRAPLLEPGLAQSFWLLASKRQKGPLLPWALAFAASVGAHSSDVLSCYFLAPEKNPVDVKGEGNETSNMVITWKVRGPRLSVPQDIRPGCGMRVLAAPLTVRRIRRQ